MRELNRGAWEWQSRGITIWQNIELEDSTLVHTLRVKERFEIVVKLRLKVRAESDDARGRAVEHNIGASGRKEDERGDLKIRRLVKYTITGQKHHLTLIVQRG